MKLKITLFSFLFCLIFVFSNIKLSAREPLCGPFLQEDSCRKCCAKLNSNNLEQCICQCFEGICSYKRQETEFESNSLNPLIIEPE